MPKDLKNSPSGVRPVGARALKSAIDTLRPYLSGATVLDLYAGQGRFGLAACKEGASSVFVESSHKLCREMEAEAAKFSYDVEVFPMDVMGFLKKAQSQALKFDVIFADPPFPNWSPEFEAQLFTAVAPITASGSIFLVKYPTRVLASPSFQAFSVWKCTPFGESELRYFRANE